MKYLKTILLSLVMLIALTGGSQNIFKIPGTVFDMDCYLIVTKDTAKARSFAAKYAQVNVETEFFENRALTVYNPGYPLVVWIPYYIDTPERRSIINHELMHVVSAVLKWAGIPLSEDTEELYAFMMQYYSKEFYDFLLKTPLR